MSDENAFLRSALAEAPVGTWGGHGATGPYQAPSCLVTKEEALGSVATPCSLEVAAVGDSRPGPRSQCLVAASRGGCPGRKWGICCFTRATPALCKRGTAAAEAKERWCCLKVPHTLIWGTPPYQSVWDLSLPRGVARGEEHLLASCLQRKARAHDETWGLPYRSHHLPSRLCQGRALRPYHQNQKCNSYI